ncbi:MAG: hypothetical protein ACJ76X_12130 [Solirubrobacteraceae bacterium]
MRVNVRARRTALLAMLVFAALPAGSALADTTIGQVGATDVIACGSPAVFADTNYVVPAGGGFITSFSFQSESGNAGNQFDFLVLRPTGGGAYQVIGKTGPVTLAGTGGIETFSPPAPIAVRGGDILGWWSGAPNVVSHCLRGAPDGTGGAIGADQASDPRLSDSLSLSGTPQLAQFDINESANLAPPIPTRTDECKNGGWQSLIDNKGQRFKNQGDCVSYVATGGKNPAKG